MRNRFLASLVLLAAAPFALAQSLSPGAPAGGYTEGKEYFAINPPQPTASGNKVEVVEVFSYGCIHCANFQPLVDKWKKAMPPAAAFAYLPAMFRADFALFGRGFYTAEVLGVLDKTHDPMFKAIFIEHQQFRTMEDLAQFYAKYGVKADDFLSTATSFAVETKVSRANTMVQRYAVDGTPTMVVNGKYRVTGASAGGYDKVFDVVNFLIAKEAAAAPKKS